MKTIFSTAKKGFTLIEMLIVMAVVSILIAIIIPSYRGMQQDAWIAKAEKELQTIQAAVESYYRHQNKYPDTLNDLLGAKPKIITKTLDDPWKTVEVVPDEKYTYGYFKGSIADFGDYYVIYSQGIDQVDATLPNLPVTTPNITANGDDIIISNLPMN